MSAEHQIALVNGNYLILQGAADQVIITALCHELLSECG